jgi:hypothetical protein
MYKVIYQLPLKFIREIILSEQELKTWLSQACLRDRIISYERIK